MAVWREYPFAPMYEVSEDGEVRKGDKILKQYRQKNGYVYVWLNRGFGNCSTPVHRMVAETFLVRGKNDDRVDHIDTNRANNKVDNLRWTDALGNANNETTKMNMSKAQRKSRVRGLQGTTADNRWPKLDKELYRKLEEAKHETTEDSKTKGND